MIATININDGSYKKVCDFFAEKSDKFICTGDETGTYDNALNFNFAYSGRYLHISYMDNCFVSVDLSYAGNFRMRFTESNNMLIIDKMYNSSFAEQNTWYLQIILFKLSDSYYYACQMLNGDIADQADALSTGFRSVSDDSAKSVQNRLPYIRDREDGSIKTVEIIENKVLTDYGTALNPIAVTEMIDCSFIPPKRLYTLDGKDYYAVNSHTLVKV